MTPVLTRIAFYPIIIAVVKLFEVLSHDVILECVSACRLMQPISLPKADFHKVFEFVCEFLGLLTRVDDVAAQIDSEVLEPLARMAISSFEQTFAEYQNKTRVTLSHIGVIRTSYLMQLLNLPRFTAPLLKLNTFATGF